LGGQKVWGGAFFWNKGGNFLMGVGEKTAGERRGSHRGEPEGGGARHGWEER